MDKLYITDLNEQTMLMLNNTTHGCLTINIPNEHIIEKVNKIWNLKTLIIKQCNQIQYDLSQSLIQEIQLKDVTHTVINIQWPCTLKKLVLTFTNTNQHIQNLVDHLKET